MRLFNTEKKKISNVLTFNQTDLLSIYNRPDTEQQQAYIKEVSIIMPTLQMRKVKQLELQRVGETPC